MTGDDLRVLSPILGVAAAAGLVLIADLALPASGKRFIGPLAAALLLIVLGLTWATDSSGYSSWGGYAGGAGTLFFQRLFLAAGIVAVSSSLAHVATQTRRRQGEYYFLLLCSLLGMMLLPGVRDLILLLIAFETMGMPLYVLAAFEKRDGTGGARRASEAGIKLFLVGSASTAVSLFGLSLLAGLSGGTSFAALASAPSSPLFLLGVMFVLAGIGFKLGVAPFHMWVPDTYEGASGPFVAFLAGAPKIAALAALCSVFVSGLGGFHTDWAPAVAGLAVLTMAVGSLLAIPQKNVRRMLAYSGVAHVGYMLLAFSAGTAKGLAMVLFYAVAYVATNAGVFLVAHAVAADGGNEATDGLRGLHRRSPGLALAMLVFLLSLAGIPFVAGFWAKVYVFVAAWDAGLHGLVGAGVLFSVVALFFYLQLARAAYFDEPGQATAVHVAPGLRAAIIACLVAVVGIGAWPGPLLDASSRAAGSFFEPVVTAAIATRPGSPLIAAGPDLPSTTGAGEARPQRSE